MAARNAFRYVSRRFSSGGKILSEEEKAAENVYIKKIEQEKLQKLAHKGPKPEETATSGPATDVKASAADASTAGGSTAGASTEKTSSDKNRNYAVVAGVVTVFGALGWYLNSREKKSEQMQE